jgi:pimeloyl-ACP methyl ester carboxylesterase
MDAQRRLVRVPDGRDVEVFLAGPEDGMPLVVHDGTPVGLIAPPETINSAGARGLRYVQIARPGYEGSTPRPGRRVADVAPDVAAVVDWLGAREFVSIGMSGGGPHALASAACLPGRCLAAASIAGVGPYQAEGLDFLDGMGPENHAEFGAAFRGASALETYLDKEAAALAGVTAEDVIAALGGLISPADAAVLTGEYADLLVGGLHAAVRAGIAGWRDDDLAFVSDWGFSLEALAGRVAIWQGDQDRMVPFAHGQWLAGHIPGARAHLEPGEGHLTMTVTAIGRILDDLLDVAGRPGPAAAG